MLDLLVHDPLTRLFAQIMAIVITARLLGVVARAIGQPIVIAEIVAGILLGPSLLGWVLPDTAGILFPPESLGALQLVSQLGLVLFMFLIGLELDPKLLSGRARSSVFISQAGIAVPFALGALLAVYTYPRWSEPSVSPTAYALFLGTAMSVTAFPVLARILSERRLLRSRVGAMTLACAAVDDVSAWCLLAFVVAVARAKGLEAAATTTGLTVVYIGLMFGVVRPLLHRMARRFGGSDGLGQGTVALVMLLLFASSWTTELIGIHALFGAFVLGAVLPKEGGLAHALAEKLEDLVLVVLLPLFFAYSGVRTQIGLLDSWEAWATCGLVIAVATVGKFGGCAAAARMTGLSWRESGALGILMNTRGLMELIVLNIGLDLGVITPTVFAMMVVMALVTTIMTSPVLQWVYPQEQLARDLLHATSEPAQPRFEEPFRVLVCVASGRSGPGLVSLAAALRGDGKGGLEVRALHLAESTDRASSFIGDQGADGQRDVSLEPLLAQARELDVEVSPMSFVSTDPADDICRIAEVNSADLVLMGWHRPLVSQTLLGGVVYDVMANAPAKVGVFVDRGLGRIRRVLVPFRESPHDRAALMVASRLAVGGVQIDVLEVRTPEDPTPRGEGVGQLITRMFGAHGASVGVRTVTDASPVDVVLEASGVGYDLVVVGVGRAWGLEERRIGRHPERLMNESPASLLIVRGSEATAGAATPAHGEAIVA